MGRLLCEAMLGSASEQTAQSAVKPVANGYDEKWNSFSCGGLQVADPANYF